MKSEKKQRFSFFIGKKEYKACVSQGRFPYLPVLDDILSRENIQTEQNMGLI